MLELALQLRLAIDRYATLDKKYTLKPDEVEWDAVQALMDCLKVFYGATLKFSGIKYPTLNLFFPEFCEVYISIKKWRAVIILLLFSWAKKCLLSGKDIGPMGIHC